jgi:hypothetical protein
VGHPETHPHTQGAVGYVEYSSRTLAPGLQLCKECSYSALRGALVRVSQLSRFQHASMQPRAEQPQDASIFDPRRDKLPQKAPVEIVETSTDIRIA